MTPLLFAAWYHPLFMVAMLLTAIFLILIVLVQRGRGGGLCERPLLLQTLPLCLCLRLRCEFCLFCRGGCGAQ